MSESILKLSKNNKWNEDMKIIEKIIQEPTCFFMLSSLNLFFLNLLAAAKLLTLKNILKLELFYFLNPILTSLQN